LASVVFLGPLVVLRALVGEAWPKLWRRLSSSKRKAAPTIAAATAAAVIIVAAAAIAAGRHDVPGQGL